MSAFDALGQLSQIRSFKPDIYFVIGILLFFIFGGIAIIKAKIEQRKAQKELKEFKREFEKFKSEQISINSRAESGSQSLSIGTSHAPVTQQLIQPKEEKEPPNVAAEGTPYIQNGYLSNSGYTIPIGVRGEPLPYYLPPTNVLFAQVDFSNNPKSRLPENTARNVRATITYYENGKLLGSTSGCWKGIDGADDSEMVDLLSNGKPRTLYLAMRYELENTMSNYPLWMFGMETTHTYFLDRKRDFRFRLCDGENQKQFDIKVKLIGERVEREFAFRLYYEGKAKEMRIEVKK